MKTHCRVWVLTAIAAAACFLVEFAAAQSETISLWPGTAPGDEAGSIEPEKVEGPRPGASVPVTRMTNVSEPRLEFFPAPAETNSGAAVVVCPGGGYNILAHEHEGTMVIDWLNGIGVNGVLLKYRVPRREGREKHEAPLQDVQRAIGIVRQHSKEWGIDPAKIGLLGFSAGGHLTLTAGTHDSKRTYPKVDAADEQDCRPSFLIPVYPAYLVEKGDDGSLPPEIRIDGNTPPIFLAHADDDKHSAEGSARVYTALKHAGTPCEVHIYAKGGHGFGMFKDRGPASSWPDRCEEWMRSMGWLTP